MTATLDTAIRLILNVHICDQRRSYTATFSSDDAAVDFIARKSSTHAFHIVNDEDDSISAAYPKTMEALFPICEHGLSLQLCSGPNHFGEPTDEWAN